MSLALPTNVEAEQAVLGSILLEPEALYQIDLGAPEFYLEKHQWIYAALGDLSRTGQKVDYLTLVARMEQAQQLALIGGSAYLTQILNSTPTAAHVVEYAGLVRREYIKRQILAASQKLSLQAYDSKEIETADLKAQALAVVNGIDVPARQTVKPLADAIIEFLPTFNDYCDRKAEVWGIPTGLDLDKYTGGLQAGDLWIVAGKPGKGKTSLVLNIASFVSEHHTPTLLFSLEMTIEKLMLRLYAGAGNLSSEDLRRGRVTAEQRVSLMDRLSELSNSSLYLVEQQQSTDSIRAHVSQLKLSGVELKLVIVDYLRLLRDRAESDLVKTLNISRALKILARDYGLTVILVHALNRKDGEDLQSLAYGGDYDADVVILTQFEDDRPEHDKRAVLRIVKNRNGRTGDVPMLYLEGQTKWANPSKLY